METVEYPASLQWVGTIECPNCQTVTRAWRSSGMSDMRPHFYCDRCSNVIHRVSDYEKTYYEKSEKILDEISASLPACPCGGRFKPGANPKCPKCRAEFAHQNTPLERLSDPHMIVMDGACVFSEKNDPYRVKIIDE